jgi:hypothetical protein
MLREGRRIGGSAGRLVTPILPQPPPVILTKVRIQSHVVQRTLPWVLTFVRMTGDV